MDTRFWGPSGWRLLHLISFQAPTLPTSKLRVFWEHLPYVLPCKYCRASLTDYMGADPHPAAAAEAAAWMYRIHNRVNCKLKEQKLLDAPNPKWSEIKERYEAWIAAPCTRRRMLGWDFLYSIANTTPSATTKSTPMPGAPPSLPTVALQNRWNTLSAQARLPHLATWWSLLGAVLPFAEWRAAWATAVAAQGPAPLQKGRRGMVAWLYRMERATCAALKEATPHNSFEGLCSELATFSSGCGKSKRSKTCRATKMRARTTLRQRRRGKFL
jgi:hypothetical protein